MTKHTYTKDAPFEFEGMRVRPRDHPLSGGGVMIETPVDTYVDCYDETSVLTLDQSHESGLILNVNDMYSDTGRGIYLNKEQARDLADALTAYAEGEW